MRKLSTITFAALFVLALAPAAFCRDHEQQPPVSTHAEHQHSAQVPQVRTVSHNHGDHTGHNGHREHRHSILQQIRHVLFGVYHLNGACPPAHDGKVTTGILSDPSGDSQCAEHGARNHDR
jgi:hypothetical protein